MIGGLGPCGRVMLYIIFREFATVTIKMANIIKPSKISGFVENFMLFKYENETYVELMKRLPDVETAC